MGERVFGIGKRFLKIFDRVSPYLESSKERAAKRFLANLETPLCNADQVFIEKPPTFLKRIISFFDHLSAGHDHSSHSH